MKNVHLDATLNKLLSSRPNLFHRLDSSNINVTEDEDDGRKEDEGNDVASANLRPGEETLFMLHMSRPASCIGTSKLSLLCQRSRQQH